MHALALILCLLADFAIGAGNALAQSFEAGEIVVLVERDTHIPAHPGPGDSKISLRFASGSTGNILSVDPGTGWLEIRGDRAEGGEGTGWIVARYVAGRAGEGPSVPSQPEPGLEPAWCPQKGTPGPHGSGRLRLATWNIGNLHARDGGTTFTGSDPSVQRFATDYERIKCYVRLFDPDILAVQEIDGEAALRRVVDTDVYDVLVSQRPQQPGMGGKQNTGFAYKKGLGARPQPDVTALDTAQGALRWGARLDITFGGQNVKLMSVHLKSGCFDNASSGGACNSLFRQIPRLEAWIDEAAAGPDPFIVLGDLNRRFNLEGDIVWANLDDGAPPNADLTAVTENMPISCRENTFTAFIDHIVFDRRAIAWADRSSFRQMTFREADRPVWDKISDHCPVMIELWPR